MRYEHLVEINDPSNPAVPLLSRAQLWFGLLCRAEDAVPFLPGLEACVIVARAPLRLERELRFGSVTVHDIVTLQPEVSVRFDSRVSDEHAGGSLTITIEAPEAERLFLRFAYETTLGDAANSADPADAENAAYIEFVKSAYHASDLDTVRVIRRLAEDRRVQ